jgi:hypothetical protein
MNPQVSMAHRTPVFACESAGSLSGVRDKPSARILIWIFGIAVALLIVFFLLQFLIMSGNPH